MKWFTKKERPLPEGVICRNCDTPMTGRYCHQCGQDFFAGKGIPILKLIGQVLENAFALDGKTPKTLAFLLIRPGFLSSEYMKGRISRYVNPVKLFWMATLIFFALVFINLDNLNLQNNENMNFKLGGNNITNVSFVETLLHFFSKFAPYISFLFIPFFALLLALFFWRNKYYYVHHLIFTIHFHTFLWIYSSLILIFNIFFTVSLPNWCQNILILTPGIYFVVALHQFYLFKVNNLKSWWQTIWKSLFITFTYFLVVSIITVSIFVLFIKIKYPELMANS